MSKLDILFELYGDQFIVALGFEKAIIGFDENSQRIIYSAKKIVNLLIKEERLTYDEALEWYELNMLKKNNTNKEEPIYCNDLSL
jgi:hypothetical protein